MRHVGRAVGDEDAVVRLGEVLERGERREEVMREADAVLAAILGIAAVRGTIGRRGEIAADVARRERVAGRAVHQPRERSRVALRHQHHDPHAGVE